MSTRLILNANQAKVLQVLGQTPELSPAEIAVYSQLLPQQVTSALNGLEQMGLAFSTHPGTRRTGERLLSLTGDGHVIYRALSQYGGLPPVGTVMPVPTHSFWPPIFTSGGTIAGSGTPYVVVGPDESEKR